MKPNSNILEKLSESASKVEEYMERILQPRRPEVLYDAARHLILAGGKRLRPYLTLKSCELFGGDTEVAVPYAAGLEILHNFTLIHDDVMDHDELRRKVPTVHVKWGEPMGILSGDLLFVKVSQAMIEPALNGRITAEKAISCIEKMSSAMIEICEGQALDTAFPSSADIDEDDYLFMVRGKTAALFRACAEIGAIVGGAGDNDVDKIGNFALNAGIAFQIVDDVLGIISDEETLGKPVGSDLREGKKTMIVIHALGNASLAERKALKKVLGVEDAEASDIEAANAALQSTGSVDYAKQRAKQYAEKAASELGSYPESAAKRDLLEFVEFVCSRIY
ncbi:MAG: polyprenyl synthetase family protein [Candidatus Bathyarchaeota archaeon]|nr:MAG: polyprenyl synthetase family protein [Candidatus Bathyarchaeota archaeon]